MRFMGPPGCILALGTPGGPAPRPADAGARMIADARRGAMIIELAPVDLPAHASHHQVVQPPVAILQVPAGGWIYGFHVEVVDADGRLLPPELVHHFNLIDPDHRELFLPISRRLVAAGKETGDQRLPWLLFGLPLERGSRVLASAMVENPTPTAYRGARVRLVLPYVPDGRPWPFFRVFPWQLDVAFPVGDKSFDLPPGRWSKSYEGSPVVAGIFVPDRRVTWPAANPADSLYQQDLRHAMRLVGSEHDMNMHHAMSHH